MVLRRYRDVKKCWGIAEGRVGITKMILWSSKGSIGRWKSTEVEERVLVEITGEVVCTSKMVCENQGLWNGLWKSRSTYHFLEISAYFVLKIELLLTLLSNFKKDAFLKNSCFWWVVCLTHTVLWSVYSLIINLTALA